MADERASLRALLLYFLRLGTLGFGGPIALAGHMEQDLVEQRGWISAQEYKEGLAFAQLARARSRPQLAIYLGWVRAGCSARRWRGSRSWRPRFSWCCAVRAVRPLRRAAVDARVVLRDRRRGHCHHRPQCAETRADDAGPRSPALDSLRRERRGAAWTESEIILGLLGVRARPMLLRGRRTTPATAALALLPVAPGLASGLGGPRRWEYSGRSLRISLAPASSCSGAGSRSCRSCTGE